MDTKVALCSGEYEPPSFAYILKTFKQKVGKDKLEEMMSNFSHDKSLLNMFTFLWSETDAHCLMSPVIGDGGKNRQKSLNVRQLVDIYLKVGEKERAMENLNISLMLSPQPSVPLPYEELCYIHRQPLSSSASKGTESVSESNLKITSCRLCLDAMAYSENSDLYDCVMGCKYLGLRPLHRILIDKDSDQLEKTTPKSDMSEKSTPKSMPKNGKKSESKNSTGTDKVEELQVLETSNKLGDSGNPFKEIKKTEGIPEVKRHVELLEDQWELETGNSENEDKELLVYRKKIEKEIKTVSHKIGGYIEDNDLNQEESDCTSNPLKRLRSPDSALRIAEDYIPSGREEFVEGNESVREEAIDSKKESCLKSDYSEKGLDSSHELRHTTESNEGTSESIDATAKNDECEDTSDVLEDKTDCKSQEVSDTLDAAVSEKDKCQDISVVSDDKTECEAHEGSDTLSETEVDVKLKTGGTDSSDHKETGEDTNSVLLVQAKNLSDSGEMSEFDANRFKESFKLRQASGFGGARPKRSELVSVGSKDDDKQTNADGENGSSNCGSVIDKLADCPYGNGINKTEVEDEARATSEGKVKASQGETNCNEGKSAANDMGKQLPDCCKASKESQELNLTKSCVTPCYVTNSVCAYPDYLSGLEMRAVLMHSFKEYDRCLEALDLIFKYNIPDAYLKPLVELKQKCLQEINKGPKKKSREIMFAYGTSVAPKLSEANSTYPALSTAVECKFSSNRGKYLIASRDIRPGEILAVEEPYCCIVNRGEMSKFCAKCLQRCIDPIPCPDCCVVIFCSDECVVSDWKHPHWPLCNVVLPSLVAMKMDSIVMLAAHVLTQTSYLKLREEIEELCNEEALPGHLKGLNKDGIYTSEEYRSVYHLLTNEEARSVEQRFDVANEAFVLAKLLRESRRYFVDKEGRPFIPTLEDMALTGTTAMRHLMSLRCSAIALSEMRVVTTDPDDTWTSCIGCGVYPSICLANHSCTPNSALYNSGKTVVMFSTRTISKNSPVTISYVTHFRLTSTDIRRSILFENYFISCACQACTEDWFPDFEEIFELKCVKCSKAIDLKKGICSKCQIYYREGKDFKDSPYNFFFVKDKLYQAASTCKKMRQKILSKVSCSVKDVSNITNAIELMEKYVKEPCSMLLDAQETLRLSFLREGSWLIVKDRTKGWFMGPAFLINSSLTSRDEVFKDDAEGPKYAPPSGHNTTPKRRRRPTKQSQEAESSMLYPPPPFVPMWNPPRVELPK